MASKEPVVEQSITANGVSTITPWAEAREQLEQAGKYWLATVRPNEQPHVMPVFGIWLADKENNSYQIKKEISKCEK